MCMDWRRRGVLVTDWFLFKPPPNRQALTANLCCLLHGLCEDIEESRAYIGQHPGILKMLAQNLRPGGGGAYRANFEAFHLITLLGKDFANVMDVQNTQHMMGNIRQLKARWKDTEIAEKVTNFLTKFDKTVARMRRQEVIMTLVLNAWRNLP